MVLPLFRRYSQLILSFITEIGLKEEKNLCLLKVHYLQPRREYAIELNSSNLIADFNHMERVQPLVSRIEKGLRLVLNEERL